MFKHPNFCLTFLLTLLNNLAKKCSKPLPSKGYRRLLRFQKVDLLSQLLNNTDKLVDVVCRKNILRDLSFELTDLISGYNHIQTGK